MKFLMVFFLVTNLGVLYLFIPSQILAVNFKVKYLETVTVRYREKTKFTHESEPSLDEIESNLVNKFNHLPIYIYMYCDYLIEQPQFIT